MIDELVIGLGIWTWNCFDRENVTLKVLEKTDFVALLTFKMMKLRKNKEMCSHSSNFLLFVSRFENSNYLKTHWIQKLSYFTVQIGDFKGQGFYSLSISVLSVFLIKVGISILIWYNFSSKAFQHIKSAYINFQNCFLVRINCLLSSMERSKSCAMLKEITIDH